MSRVYVLYHGKYGTMDKEVISVHSTLEGARERAELVTMEDESTGMGRYAPGPGITYSADSGILFRGQQENHYCLWAVGVEVAK